MEEYQARIVPICVGCLAVMVELAITTLFAIIVRRTPMATLAMGVGHVLAVVVLFVVLAVGVPHLIKLFEGFDTELPSITITVIQMAHFASRGILISGPLALLLVGGDVALFYAAHRFHRFVGIGLVLLTSGMLGFIAFVICAGVRMPILKMMNDLS